MSRRKEKQARVKQAIEHNRYYRRQRHTNRKVRELYEDMRSAAHKEWTIGGEYDFTAGALRADLFSWLHDYLNGRRAI